MRKFNFMYHLTKGLCKHTSILNLYLFVIKLFIYSYKRCVSQAFDTSQCRFYEEPRLREQDFGNFQEKDKMENVMKERDNYGRFFYRYFFVFSVLSNILCSDFQMEKVARMCMIEYLLFWKHYTETSKSTLYFNFFRLTLPIIQT